MFIPCWNEWWPTAFCFAKIMRQKKRNGPLIVFLFFLHLFAIMQLSCFSANSNMKLPLSLCCSVYIFQLLLCVCVCVSLAACVLQCVLHSPPESWELMSTLWQYRDGGAGLSRIDVSWRRFVVAHPCTLGTIKLKIIGSESPPFIDPLESVNSSRHKPVYSEMERNVHTPSNPDTRNQRAVEEKEGEKGRGKRKEGRHLRV